MAADGVEGLETDIMLAELDLVGLAGLDPLSDVLCGEGGRDFVGLGGRVSSPLLSTLTER